MKFEVGQKWETRDGRVAEVVRVGGECGGVYPVSAKIGEAGTPYSFTLEGRYWVDAQNPKDLVRLIEEVKPKFFFAKGQKWLTRDGRVATVATTDRGSRNYPIGVTIGDDPFVWSYCEEGTPYKNQGDQYDRDLVRLIGDVPDEGQWIEWEGGENPVPGSVVEVRSRAGSSWEEEANNLIWSCLGWSDDIKAYLVVKAAPAPEPEPEPKPEPFTITEPGDYVTRDGRKVVVVALNLRGNFPTLGYIVEDGLDNANMWLTNGKVYTHVGEDRRDIVGRWNPYAGIAIDTPVWVRSAWSSGYGPWVARHFAGVRNGELTCWEDGKTSHTVQNQNAAITWDELSLTKPE